MPPEQSALVERLRTALADQTTVREVPMFGGRALMVDGAMLVSAQKDGGLLVRIDPERHEELLGRPGAARAFMGPQREMGPGWVLVAADALSDDEQLSAWVAVAMEHHRAARVTASR